MFSFLFIHYPYTTHTTTMLLLQPPHAPNFRYNSLEPSSENSSQGNDDSFAESKAAQRRAQIRRAQIQHRQRKANYVKELEQEVAKIRQQIEDMENGRKVLRVENEGMRAQLRSRGLVQQPTPPLPPPPPQRQLLQQQQQQQQQQQGMTGPWYMSDEIDFTVTMQLNYDEVLGAPCYIVSRLSSPGHEGSLLSATTARLISPGFATFGAVTATAKPGSGPVMFPAPPRTATFGPVASRVAAPASNTPINNHHQEEIPELPYMTPPQIQTAINFILALEHICRDHFHLSHFSSSVSSPPSPPSLLPQFNSNSGHTLMATSLALQSAPSSVFTAAKKTRLFPGSSVNLKPPSSPPKELVEWETSALTLRNLYRLSKALEKEGEDEVEVTPVQAWFELVGKYGLERVIRGVEELKRGVGRQKGVVRCPHYGARLGRGEWEGLVRRVMGRE
ncbi:hypothetical protein QBC36DRAFT_361267 [Triangularia setosa]|uniref:BZIP domain-containing protein n=1 Tax=Triangularia setosa TaxID=2587417 RepID=A0AAN6WJR3_9PEZI|nr:hypothetical protein QBC36DRAFT_361267 [Podospora setosa]